MKLGVLGFGDLWHLLFSSEWACCVLAVLGIPSLSRGRACCVSAIWASFPFIQIGHAAFGQFWAFVLS